MHNPLKKPDSSWEDMLPILVILAFVLALLAAGGLLGSDGFFLGVFPIS